MDKLSLRIVQSLIEGTPVEDKAEAIANTIAYTLAPTDPREDPEFGYDERPVTDEEIAELDKELLKLSPPTEVADATYYDPGANKFYISKADVEKIAEIFIVGNDDRGASLLLRRTDAHRALIQRLKLALKNSK